MKRFGTVLAAALIGASVLVPFAGRAATPSEGTLKPPLDNKTGERATLEYTGGPTGGGIVLQDTGAQPICGDTVGSEPPVQCDVFTLHVDVPTTYWSDRAGVVTGYLEATIDWTDQPSATTQDIDLIITDAEGNKVGGGETDNISNETSSELARVLQPDAGDYRVIAVGIIGAVPSYKGTLKWTLEPAQAVNVRQAAGIQFGPATVVNPTLFGGEPGINGDPSKPNTWYVDWPVSSRAMMGMIHRSTDGGETFKLMTDPQCPQRRQPGCATGGGGDTEVAISKNGVVYFANQEVLANEAACASPDRGTNWPLDRCHAITSLDPENDRQWLAAYDDDTAYLAATAALGESIVRTDDGGKTWTNPKIVEGETDGAPAAPIVVDRTGGPLDGTLYVATSRGPITVNVSRDKAGTFTSFPNDTETKTGLWFAQSLFIPWLTMDTAGNLYSVWTDPADHAVYMSTMMPGDPRNAGARLGSTWSPPTRVSAPPARSTVLTQIIAGDPGRVAIAFQGADSGVVSDNVPQGTEWRVYASFSDDALCWWKKSCAGNGPAFDQALVSTRVNHVNEICVSGLGCTVNGKDRTLLDFFDVGIDTDGRVGVTWTDTQNGLLAGTIMFAKVLNGPSLYASRPAFRATMPKPGKRGLAGDAIWPVNGTPGANNKASDLTGDALTAAGQSLRISVNVGATDLAEALDAGYQTHHVKYVTRWHHGADAYFVAADFDGTDTTFYGGTIDDNDALYSPVSGPTAIFGMKYVRDFDVEGSFANGVLSFTVPRDSVGSPKDGDTLYSVQSFTISGLPDEAVTLYTAPDTIDATPPVDIVLAKPTSVLGKKTNRPAGKTTNKGSLASTGLGDTGMILGVALIAVAAMTRRLLRRTEDFA